MRALAGCLKVDLERDVFQHIQKNSKLPIAGTYQFRRTDFASCRLLGLVLLSGRKSEILSLLKMECNPTFFKRGFNLRMCLIL